MDCQALSLIPIIRTGRLDIEVIVCYVSGGSLDFWVCLTMKITAAGLTYIGCGRSNNEDRFCIVPESCLYIVADGMGGCNGGEVASQMAVEAIKWYFSLPSLADHDDAARLSAAISYANQQVYSAGKNNPLLHGMGTTIASLLAEQDKVIICFVGDSRLYLHRDHQIRQLTQDHTWANQYVSQGILTEKELKDHPFKHVLDRAVGTEEAVEVETLQQYPQSGDIFMLCSDGVSNPLEVDEMNTLFSKFGNDIEELGAQIISLVQRKEGQDNATVVLVRYL